MEWLLTTVQRQKVIGSGGFGRVFLGRYGRQVVAVKQLSSSGMDEEVCLVLVP